MKTKTTAIVLSAGQGKRMNSSIPKQYLLLENKPILYYSLLAFETSEVDEIILVIGKEDLSFVKNEVLTLYSFKKIVAIVEGGKERYHSVYAGLKRINESDYVLIHDGARPFLTHEIINRMLKSVQIHKACVAGMPSKDTIKVVNSNREVIDTPNRSYVWNVQTPQAFSYDIIMKAYNTYMEKEESPVTDDAMVVETVLHFPVVMIEGSYNNIKITTPEDLIVAEAIQKHKKHMTDS